MTILITGGSGTTASRLAQALASAPEPYHFLVASRSGKSRNQFPAVVFDWKDETTYGNAFTSPQAQQSPITAVYIVAPNDLDLNTAMTPFLDFAKEKGVKRFVLLSASSIEPGGPMMGSVHKYLLEMGVEYTVLRPTWFMENIVEHGWRLNFIRDQDSIFSATGDGKMPFVSADDIAAVALRALTDEKAHNTDHIILGPELLSYDEVSLPITFA